MSLFIDVYCYPNGSSVSVDPGGRLHVGNKYIWVSFHPYCGPSFYHGDMSSNLRTKLKKTNSGKSSAGGIRSSAIMNRS